MKFRDSEVHWYIACSLVSSMDFWLQGIQTARLDKQ